MVRMAEHTRDAHRTGTSRVRFFALSKQREEVTTMTYVYTTNVAGHGGQYGYVQQVTGGTVNSSGQQRF